MTDNQHKHQYAQRLFETKRVLNSMIKNMNDNGTEPCNTDNDFAYSIDVEYQNLLGKDEDDWDIDKEEEAAYLKSLAVQTS